MPGERDADGRQKLCHKDLTVADIKAVATPADFAKYTKFKANCNPRMRQCPKCEFTQEGNPDNPSMTCKQ